MHIDLPKMDLSKSKILLAIEFKSMKTWNGTIKHTKVKYLTIYFLFLAWWLLSSNLRIWLIVQN